MRRPNIDPWKKFSLVAVIMISASPTLGAGFGIFEQGSKAMGMAGAFAAQANDPSALFHNVGGLAFFEERSFLLGATYIGADSDFSGSGAVTGVTAEQESIQEIPPHFYWVEPVSSKLAFGLAINSPFGLTTEWKNPDDFPGRFISEKASIKVVDLVPNLGFKLSDKLGVGLGLIARFSEIELRNRQTALIPGIPVPLEVAKVRLESDFEEGFGWQLGLLHKANTSFSSGLWYKSSLEVDFSGDVIFTQVPTGDPMLDAFLRMLLPFDQTLPAEATIEFPDMAGLGFALALSPTLLVETDFNWTGWSSIDVIDIRFNNPSLPDGALVENWDDVWNYRLGVRWSAGSRSEWRFGYVYDESPQPEESVSPLLPDTDRQGLTIGYGTVGGKVSIDVALEYLDLDDRTTNTNRNGFTGTYTADAWLFGATIGW